MQASRTKPKRVKENYFLPLLLYQGFLRREHFLSLIKAATGLQVLLESSNLWCRKNWYAIPQLVSPCGQGVLWAQGFSRQSTKPKLFIKVLRCLLSFSLSYSYECREFSRRCIMYDNIAWKNNGLGACVVLCFENFSVSVPKTGYINRMKYV